LSGGASCERRTMLDNIIDVVNGGTTFICDLEMASYQTMAVSMIHDGCTVEAVEGETVSPQSGPSQTFIPGIEAIMRKAFAQERLFGPWINRVYPDCQRGRMQARTMSLA